jgi:hypothetical protein
MTSIPRFHQSVCGMVFFGAPHRGLHNPQLQNILSSKPPEDLVRDLRPDSSLLISLNLRFPYVCKDMKIISCYETHETKTPQLVDRNDPDSKWERSGPTAYLVPKSSACLDWPEESELRIPVHADHSKIAKLTNSYGSEYHQIKDQIRNLIDMAPEIMRRQQERYLANQNLLNLFLMFQYEYFWFKAWEMHILGRTPPHESSSDALQLEDPRQVLSSVPYGHPSYPIVTEIHIIIGALGQLLEKYRVPRQAKLPNEEEGSSVNEDLIQVPSWSMPREFGSHVGIHVTLQGSVESQSDHAYGLSNWSSSDRKAFGNTMTKFRQANQELSNLNPPTPSLDLIASSKLLSILPTKPGSLGLVESVSQLDKLYSYLSKRASLMRKYQISNLSEEDEKLLFPLSSIHISKGAGSSNFRCVSDLQPRENSVQDGKLQPINPSRYVYRLTAVKFPEHSGCWWNGDHIGQQRTSRCNSKQESRLSSLRMISTFPTNLHF